MKLITEFFKLAKLILTTKPSEIEELDLLAMDYFPAKGSSAMMWCGKLIYRSEDEELMKWRIERIPAWLHHETIHLYQAKEYKSWFSYYLRYLWEWLKGLPGINSYNGAYYTIPFEIEAYANEENLEYRTIRDSLDTKYNLKKRVVIFRENRKNWKNYIRNL